MRTASFIATMSSVREIAAFRIHRQHEAVALPGDGELEEDVQGGAVDEHDSIDVDHQEGRVFRRGKEPLFELTRW